MARQTEFALSLVTVGAAISAFALAAPAAARDGQPKATTAACSPMEHLGAAIASLWSTNRCRANTSSKSGQLGQGNGGKAAAKPGAQVAAK